MKQHAIPEALHGKILIAGAGVSGLACARLLAHLGATVSIADNNTEALAAASAQTGAKPLSIAAAADALEEFATIVVSPGWRPDSPLLLRAQKLGIEVIGDIELAWQLDQAGCCGAPRTWLVITGTNGKTTTTAMLAAMMDGHNAKRAAAVGNIGRAVQEALLDPNRVDILVVELSSFQLHWSHSITPAVGALLNLAEDHIDWHGSMAEYSHAKGKVLRGPIAVVGVDDPRAVAELDYQRGRGGLEDTTVVGFSVHEPAAGQVGILDGALYDRAFEGGALAAADGISPAGDAGRLDALAAAAVARSQGVPAEKIAAALQGFEVSGHRGQVVHRFGGIEFVDNSKATNPHAARTALSGYPSFVWVAGGQLKGADVRPLIQQCAPRMRAAVLLGTDRRDIARALADLAPEVPVDIIDQTQPEQAMEQAVAAARSHARPGDAVVLAPAAASLDMYTGMGQRGDLFAQAAREQARPGAAEEQPSQHLHRPENPPKGV